MKEIVEKLLGGLIVSCQAYEGTPLYGAENMAKMARAAKLGGATGIRACWPDNIRAVKEAVDLPVIGINKLRGNDIDLYENIIITPTYQSAKEVIDAGCDVLALDCTIRPNRSLQDLTDLLKEIRKDYPDLPIMADLSNLDEAKAMADLGIVDIISTTLAGYTMDSLDGSKDKPNVDLVKEIKSITDIPVNAEGRIWELEDLRAVKEAGADMVTIGTAITRPHLITERFVEFNSKL